MGESSKFKKIFIAIKNNKMTNIFLVFIFMLVIATIFSPYFMTVYNIRSLIREAAFVGLVALGQSCLLILGELDLSVGNIAALSGVVSGIMMVKTPFNPFVVFALCMLFGAFLGFINGLIITGLKLNSLIVTIGMVGIYTGINLVITKGQAILNIPKVIFFMGQGSVFNIPMPTIIMVVMFIIVMIIVKLTRLGRYMYAIGNNRETAKILGLPVMAVRIFAFSLTGMLSAMAGVIMVARLGTAQPSIGNEWALNSIAAGVIGGISLAGGIGNPLGALIGIGIIIVIQNIIVLFGVSPYLQTAVSGVVVVAAISFDSISTMISSRKKRFIKNI
ncbi:MAG: ABC transporter permease [Candidatus Humimicrobiaceae bacterium]